MKLSGITQFRIIIDLSRISHLFSCEGGQKPDMACRACNVGQVMSDIATKIEWGTGLDARGNPIRFVEGYVDNDDARLALSRLIAYTQGHIDPLDLLALQQGRQPIWTSRVTLSRFER